LVDRGILTLQNRYDRLSRWSIDNEAVLRVLRLSGLYHLTDYYLDPIWEYA
ncbi:hypothetical protein Dimus_008372, partial [Dionaea muscipula]